MNDILTRVGRVGIIPVIKIEDIDKAVPLAKALKAGGVPVAEITFRAAGAEKAIAKIRTEVPDMLVGAGTVLTEEQAVLAKDAGAQFIVSPGFNPSTVAKCQELGLPITPGCATPSEIERALSMGLTAVKFFPAEQAGGTAMLKAFAGPFSSLKFIPTGGISLDNLGSYLALPNVLACGGTFMVRADDIKAGNWEAITALCRRSVETMLDFRIMHIGLNGQSEDDAMEKASLFASLLGLPVKPGNSAVFAGSMLEVTKTPGRGNPGHIAVGTSDVERAKTYLEGRGVRFVADSAKFKGDRMTLIYFEQEICGMGIHLLQA